MHLLGPRFDLVACREEEAGRWLSVSQVDMFASNDVVEVKVVDHIANLGRHIKQIERCHFGVLWCVLL